MFLEYGIEHNAMLSSICCIITGIEPVVHDDNGWEAKTVPSWGWWNRPGLLMADPDGKFWLRGDCIKVSLS